MIGSEGYTKDFLMIISMLIVGYFALPIGYGRWKVSKILSEREQK
jgi:hypothetical protein